AWMNFAGGSNRLPAVVGEGALLLVAGRARLGAVPGQTLVVEEMASELNLRVRHRIRRRHARLRKILRQAPDVRRRRRLPADDRQACQPQRCDAEKMPAPHHLRSRTTSIFSSMRIDRAPRLSCGATMRSGPW